MAIAAVSGQAGGNSADATSVTRAFTTDVSTGSLIVIVGAQQGTTSGELASGACTKSAGTATLGTISQDVSIAIDVGGTAQAKAAIWSAIVTAGGSLTMQVSQATANQRTHIATDEYTGDWDSSRLEDTAEAATATNNTNAASGDATSAGAALFIGGLATLDAGVVTISPDASYTEIYENEATGASSAIRRIVASGTTDNAQWTLGNNVGWSAVQVVYKEAAAGVVIPVFRRQYQLIKAR